MSSFSIGSAFSSGSAFSEESAFSTGGAFGNGDAPVITELVNMLNFDGTNDYTDTSENLIDFTASGTDGGIEMWITIASTGVRQVFFFKGESGGPNNGNSWSVQMEYSSSDHLLISVATSNQSVDTIGWDITTGAGQYHIVLNIDYNNTAGTILYVNDNDEVANRTVGGSFLWTNYLGAPLHAPMIGARQTTTGQQHFFAGSMAFCRLYDVLPTRSEVTELYNYDADADKGKPKQFIGLSPALKAKCIMATDMVENQNTDAYKAPFDALIGLESHINGDNGLTDLTGNHTYTNINSVTFPTNILNKKAVIRMTAANQKLLANTLASTFDGNDAARVVFYVIKGHTAGVTFPDVIYMAEDSSGNGLWKSQIRISSSDIETLKTDDAGLAITGMTDPAGSNYIMVFEIHTGGNVEKFFDSVSQGNDSLNVGVITNDNFAVGGDPNNTTDGFDDDIATFGVFDNATPARDVVERYLIAEYFNVHDLALNSNKLTLFGPTFGTDQLEIELA